MDSVTSLGSAFRPLRPSDRVDELCDRFEAAWGRRTGNVPAH
jgi:hypothetical protein